MNTRSLLALLVPVLLFRPAVAQVGSPAFELIVADPPGQGFDDPTPASPVGGNPGTTLGEQRRIAFQYAALRWGERLRSDVPIRVSARFLALPCSSTSAQLGSAGPRNVFADFPGAPQPDLWYYDALANRLAGVDLDSGADVDAEFNSVLDEGTCAFPSRFSYGLDAQPPAGTLDFVTTLLHELAHGLGFVSTVSPSGRRLQDLDDCFSRLLFDVPTGKGWREMSDAERSASARGVNGLVWAGPEVTAGSGFLTRGKTNGLVRMYAPASYEPGASVSHFDRSLFPDDLMEPVSTGANHEVGLTARLLRDIGWAGSPSAGPATYFVRPDGGSASRCTGLADAPDPGSGTAQACAWNHPFQALPPGGPARIAGGDTLVVGFGSYRMGYGAPGAEGCDPGGTWDCFLAPLPSGPDAAHPTRLLGAGYGTGCASPPELWGTERAEEVLNLTGSSHVEVGCLVVTDHSGCVEFHSGSIPCVRDTYPHGDWAVRGLYAEDSADVYLHDLDIHGLASTGVQAGRLSDWRVENVRVAGNGWVGWDGDIAGTDSNSGSMTFRRFVVEWNGCGETWPGGQAAGCWAQSAGGYGDGFGTGETSGTWLFEDSAFLHNTSDGLDLLYARAGSSITIRRTRAEGNAGNQIKTNGPAHIENTIAVGSCAFFNGKAFTYDVDDCRALGNTLSLTLRPGDLVQVVNATVTGEGDCLVLAQCDGACTGAESVRVRNDVFIGRTDFAQPFESTCLMYQETFPHGNAVFDADYLLATGVKDDDCPGTHHVCGGSAGLVNDALASFDAHLAAGSPAIDAGTSTGAPATDFDGLPRDAHPDLGALEYVSPGSCSPDTTPPVVTAPNPSIVNVNQTACSGGGAGASVNGLLARLPAQAAQLSQLLGGGSAVDACGGTPTRLPPRAGGADVLADTLIPVGSNTITFRFQDAAGNVGTATGTVNVLRQGDVNLDGLVDVFDLVLVAGYVVGNVTPGSPPFAAPPSSAWGDADTDVDIFDIVILAGFIVGNVPCLTP